MVEVGGCIPGVTLLGVLLTYVGSFVVSLVCNYEIYLLKSIFKIKTHIHFISLVY